MSERISIMLQCTGDEALVRTLIEETMREAKILGVEWNPDESHMIVRRGPDCSAEWYQIAPAEEDEDTALPATDEVMEQVVASWLGRPRTADSLMDVEARRALAGRGSICPHGVAPASDCATCSFIRP